MVRKQVLVDTVFLNKLSQYGKEIDTFKRLIDELDFKPVVHPYVARNELDMYPFFTKLVDEGYIEVIEYDAFLSDDEDKKYYESLFFDVHDEIREHLEAIGGKKQLPKLTIPNHQSVFTYRKASMSLGDVHMILMAFFLQIPVILTEDSDLELLRSITRRKMSSSTYELDIIDAVDVLIRVAQKKDNSFTKAELTSIAKKIGERSRQSDIKQAWNIVHDG